MSTATLTDEDLAFLALPLHGFLTVAAEPQPPQPRPVWFEATPDGTLQLFTAPGSVKVQHAADRGRSDVMPQCRRPGFSVWPTNWDR